jgi:tryptophan synthase beta subunit
MNKAVKKLLLYSTISLFLYHSGGIMFKNSTKNQQLSTDDQLSDEELECVAGGTANAAGITTAYTNKANLAISDAGAGVTAIDVNYDAYKAKVNYNQPS